MRSDGLSSKAHLMSVADLATAPKRLGPASNGRLMTPAEFDAVTDWDPGYRYELVHEVLVVLPPPGYGERRPNDYLGYLLDRYREEHPDGGCLDATAFEQDIVCGDNRRRADRAIWIGRGEAFDPDRDTPTIAVEFVSNTSRDRRRDYIEKRAEYAAAGVKEYWVIDRFVGQTSGEAAGDMTVFRGPEETLVVTAAETYRTPLLPGFELPLGRLLEKAGGSA